MSKKKLHVIEYIITALQIVAWILAIFIELFIALTSCAEEELGLSHGDAGIMLQVDAAIITLSITLITLMTGALDREWQGVYYSDYFLNKRPRIYKQIRIVVLSLSYFFIASLCLWEGRDYMIASALFCELLLVLISALSLYDIFKGDTYIRGEIERFSNKLQIGENEKSKGNKKNGKNKEAEIGKKYTSDRLVKAGDAQNRFIDAFCTVIKNGDNVTFLEYRKTLGSIIEYVWENRNDVSSLYPLGRFEMNCNKLLDACIESDQNDASILYLRLLDFIYERIYTNIVSNKTNRNQYDRPHSFKILSANKFEKTIESIKHISELEKIIDISKLLWRVQLMDIILFDDYASASRTKDERYPFDFWTPNGDVFDIKAYIGYYLRRKTNEGGEYHSYKWVSEFSLWRDYSNENYISENSNRLLKRSIANSGIIYTGGLLFNGLFDIVREGLYTNLLDKYALGVIGEAGCKAVLATQAYLYYIACCEDKEAVGTDLKNEAKEFIKEGVVSSNFREFLKRCDVEDALIKNLRSERRMRKQNNDEEDKESLTRVYDIESRQINGLLRRYDFRMRSDKFHRLIMSESIDDFCLFTLFYLRWEKRPFTSPEQRMRLMDWMSDEYHSPEDFTHYFAEGNNTEERIERYLEFIYADILDNAPREEKVNSQRARIDDLKKAMTDDLISEIQRQYKNLKTKESKDCQNEYDQIVDQVELWKREWKRGILSGIKDSFGELIRIEDESLTSDGNVIKDRHFRYIPVQLFTFSTFTNMVRGAIDSTNINRITWCLVEQYLFEMLKRGLLKREDKSNFDDVEKYISFIKTHGYDLFMGSEFLLKPNDYRNMRYFEEKMEGISWIKTLGSSFGAVLKKKGITFYLKNLSVDVRPATIADVSYDEDGSLRYAPVQNVNIQFEDKYELNSYVGMERKIVEVTADIGVKDNRQVVDEDTGTDGDDINSEESYVGICFVNHWMGCK